MALGMEKGRIEIDTTQAQKSVRELSNRITKMEGQGSKSASRLSTAFAGIGTAGLVAAGAGVAKMGNFLAEGLREVGQAQDIFGRISVKTRANEKALMEARKEAIRVGKETTSSNIDAAKALEELTQAGLSVEKATRLLSPTVNFAAATTYGLADSAKFATSVLKTAGLEMSEFTKISDQAAAATSATTLKIDGLVKGVEKGFQPWAQAGASFAEFSSLLGLVSDQGVVAERAGTGLRRALTELAPKTKEATKAMQDLGVSLFEEGDSRSAAGALYDVIERIQKMNAEDATATLNAIFGQDALTAVRPLINTTREDFEKLVSTMEGATGLTAELQEKAMASLSGAFEDLSGDIETVRFQMLEPFSPLVNAAVRNTGKTIVAMSDAVLPAITGLADVLKTVFLPDEGTVGDSLTRFLGGYKTRIVTEFGSLGEELKRRWDEVLANVFGRANVSARDVFAYVRSTIEEIALDAGNLDFSDINRAFRDALSGIFDLSGERTLIQVLADFFATGDITILQTEIDDLFGKVEDAVTAWIDAIQLEVKTEFKPFDDVTTTTIQADLPEVETVVNPITAWWQQLTASLRSIWDSLNFPTMGEFIENMFSGFDVSERALELHAGKQAKKYAEEYVPATETAHWQAMEQGFGGTAVGAYGGTRKGKWVQGKAVEKYVPATQGLGNISWQGPDPAAPEDERPDEPGIQRKVGSPPRKSQSHLSPVNRAEYGNVGPAYETVGHMETTYPHRYRTPDTHVPTGGELGGLNFPGSSYVEGQTGMADAVIQPFEEWQAEQPGPGVATKIQAFFLEVGDALLEGWQTFRDELGKIKPIDIMNTLADKMGFGQSGRHPGGGYHGILGADQPDPLNPMTVVVGMLQTGWTSLKSAWDTLVSNIKSQLTPESIKTAWQGITAKLQQLLIGGSSPERGSEGAGLGFSALLPNEQAKAQTGLLSPLISTLSSGWGAFKTAWDNLAANLKALTVNALTQAWDGLVSKVKTAIVPPKYLVWTYGETQPSIDGGILTPLIQSLRQGWQTVTDTWDTIVLAIQNFSVQDIQTAWASLVTRVDESVDWDVDAWITLIETDIETRWNKFVTWLTTLAMPQLPNLSVPWSADDFWETLKSDFKTKWEGFVGAVEEVIPPALPIPETPALPVEPLFQNFTQENLSKALLATMPAGYLLQAVLTRGMNPASVDAAILSETMADTLYSADDLESMDDRIASMQEGDKKNKAQEERDRITRSQKEFDKAQQSSARTQRRSSTGLVAGGIAGLILGALIEPLANYISESMTEAMKLVDKDWESGDGMTQEQRKKFIEHMMGKIPEDVTNFFANVGDWMGAGFTVGKDSWQSAMDLFATETSGYWLGTMIGKFQIAYYEVGRFHSRMLSTIMNPANIFNFSAALAETAIAFIAGLNWTGIEAGYTSQVEEWTKDKEHLLTKEQQSLPTYEKAGIILSSADKAMGVPAQEPKTPLYTVYPGKPVRQSLPPGFDPITQELYSPYTQSQLRVSRDTLDFQGQIDAGYTHTAGLRPNPYQGLGGTPASRRLSRDTLDYQSQIDAGYDYTAGLGDDKEKSGLRKWWDGLMEDLGFAASDSGDGTITSAVKEGMGEVAGEIDKGFTDYFNNDFPDTSGLAVSKMENMYGVGEDVPDKSFMGVTNLYSESSGIVLDGVMDSWNSATATINAAFTDIVSKANQVTKLADKMPKGPQQSALLNLQVVPPAAFAMGGVSQGGWAMVGERGAELVHLDKGARVYSSNDTDQIVKAIHSQGKGKGETNNFYINNLDSDAMQELQRHQNVRSLLR